MNLCIQIYLKSAHFLTKKCFFSLILHFFALSVRFLASSVYFNLLGIIDYDGIDEFLTRSDTWLLNFAFISCNYVDKMKNRKVLSVIDVRQPLCAVSITNNVTGVEKSNVIELLSFSFFCFFFFV